MAQLITVMGRLARREEGQDLIEYGMLMALIAVVAMVGITSVGDAIYNVFWKSIGQAV